MATKKFTDLLAITEIAANDLLPIVDISDTTQAASGSTKKITMEQMLGQVYPVGAVYTSVVSTNPGTIFGFGTWVSIASGKTLVGVDTSDTDFNTVKKTGGAKTHTLTSAQMPEHTHTQTAHNHTQTAHNHTQSSHNHTGPSHRHTGPSHTHPSAAHAHSGSSNSTGAHTHSTRYNNVYQGGVGSGPWSSSSGGVGWWANLSTTGAHSHTITVGSTTPGATGASGTGVTGYEGTGVTGGRIAVNVEATAVNVEAVAVNENTGGGEAHNNLQPYYTVYFFERTA